MASVTSLIAIRLDAHDGVTDKRHIRQLVVVANLAAEQRAPLGRRRDAARGAPGNLIPILAPRGTEAKMATEPLLAIGVQPSYTGNPS